MTDTKICKILLSDGRSAELPIQSAMKVEDLLNIASSNFNLRDRSFFGLVFVDQATNFVHFLKRGDSNQYVLKDEFVKDFCKEHPKEPIIFELRVLYCIEEFIALCDPAAVELFYLNAKRALCDGVLDNAVDNVVDLLAHTFLIEYGNDLFPDFVRDQLQSGETVHVPQRLLKQFRSTFESYERVYARYAELCRQRYTPFDAFMKFMNRVESLQTYGRHMYELKTRKGIPCYIGVSLQGIDHYEHTNRYQPQRHFSWDVVNSFMARDCSLSMEMLTKGRVAQQAGGSYYDAHLPHETGAGLGDAFDPLASALGDPTTQLSTSRRTYEAGSSVVYQWIANGTRQARSIVSVISMMHAYHCNRRNEKLPTEIDGYASTNISTGTDMKTLADFLLRRVNERRSALNAPIKISPSSTVSDNVSMRSASVKSSKQSDTASVITTSLSSKRLDPEAVKQRRVALQANRDSLSKLLEQKRRELLEVCLKEYRLTGKLPPETPPLGDMQLPPVRKRPGAAGVQRRQSNLSVVKQMRNSVVFSPTNSPFDAYANSSPFQQAPISEVDESLVSHGSFRERNWTPAQANPNANYHNTPSGSLAQPVGVVHRSPAYQQTPNAPATRFPPHLSVVPNNDLSRSLEDLNRNSNQNAYQPAHAYGRPPGRSETTRYQQSNVNNMRLLPRVENNYAQNAPTLTRREAQTTDTRSSGAPRYTLKQAVSNNMSASVPVPAQNYTVRSAAFNDWQSTKADSLSLGNDEVDAVSIASTQSGSLQDSGPSGASFAYTYDLHSRVAPHFVRVEVPAPPQSQVNPSVAPTEMVTLSSVQRTPSKSFSNSQSGTYGSPQLYAPISGDRNDSAEYVYKVIPAPETTGTLDNSQLTIPQPIADSELSQSPQDTPYSVTVLRTRGTHRPPPLSAAQKRLSTSDTQLNQAGLSFPPEQTQNVAKTQPYEETVTLSSRTSRPPVTGTSTVQQPFISGTQYTSNQADNDQDETPTLRRSAQLNPPAADVQLPVQSTVEIHQELFPGNYRQSTQFVSLAVNSPGPGSLAPNFADIFSNNVKDRVRGLGYLPEKTGQFWYSGNSSLDENNERFGMGTDLARPQPSQPQPQSQSQSQQPNDANRSGPNATKVLPRFV